MSDIGILTAVEAEIIAAISTPALVTGMLVVPSASLSDISTRDTTGRTPAIGVIYMGTPQATPYAVGSRKLRAQTKWRVSIAHTNLRGTAFARQDVYNLLEGIRDRVHYLHSAQSPKAAFMYEGESCPDDQPEGKIVAFMDFSLDLILGN